MDGGEKDGSVGSVDTARACPRFGFPPHRLALVVSAACLLIAFADWVSRGGAGGRAGQHARGGFSGAAAEGAARRPLRRALAGGFAPPRREQQVRGSSVDSGGEEGNRGDGSGCSVRDPGLAEGVKAAAGGLVCLKFSCRTLQLLERAFLRVRQL